MVLISLLNLADLQTGRLEVLRKDYGKTTERLLRLINNNPHITTEQLAKQLGMTPDGVYYHTQKLRKEGVLVRKGGKQKGYWTINRK